MTLKYLKKLRPILNKVGKKHGITIEEGEFIVDCFFRSFKKAITDPRVPRVMLPMFGTFQPKINYIYRSLRASFRFYRKGGLTTEYIVARVKRIWPVRNRLIEEQQSKETWKLWKSDDMLDRFEKLQLDEQEAKEESKRRIYGDNNNPEESARILREIHAGLYKPRGAERES